jgi:hypothetical protein
MTKELTHQEDIIFVNLYTSAAEALSFMKQMLLDLKAEVGPNAVTVEYLNTSLSPMSSSSRQKINKH